MGAWFAIGVFALGNAPAARAQATSDSPSAAKSETKSESKGRIIADKVPEYKEAFQKLRHGDVSACLKQLEVAAAKYPDLPPAMVMLGLQLIQDNKVPAARNVLERQAIERPDHPEVYRAFGELAFLEGRVTDAQVEFEKAAALAANDKWPAKQRQTWLMNAYLGTAAVSENRKDWKLARAALNLVLQMDQTDAFVRSRLGKAWFFLDKPDEAYSHIKRAAEEEKLLDPPEVTMGLFWSVKGDSAKAEQWFKDALKDKPKDARCYIGYGSVLLLQAKFEEARRIAEEGLKLNPASAELRFEAALAARALHDFQAAEKYLTELTAQSPSAAKYTNQLALVLAETSEEAKQQRALELATVNSRLLPNDPDAVATLGVVQYRLGRIEDAERSMQSLVNAGKVTADAAYYYALLLSEKGKKEEARKLAQSALGLNGIFLRRTDCQELQKKLEK
jgi:tetratricopeptide (TPR) repeat protein